MHPNAVHTTTPQAHASTNACVLLILSTATQNSPWCCWFLPDAHAYARREERRTRHAHWKTVLADGDDVVVILFGIIIISHERAKREHIHTSDNIAKTVFSHRAATAPNSTRLSRAQTVVFNVRLPNSCCTHTHIHPTRRHAHDKHTTPHAAAHKSRLTMSVRRRRRRRLSCAHI